MDIDRFQTKPYSEVGAPKKQLEIPIRIVYIF
jgi:hypothetical protein